MSFTVFGLWLVVVQIRRREWAERGHRRWGAQVVGMHFALPGVMSLLNLANPDSVLLWRVSFAAFALLGAIGMILLDRAAERTGAFQGLAHWGAILLYAAVAFVALFAGDVAAAVGVSALQVEAVLLSILLFLGLNVAFAMLFAGVRSDQPASSDR